MLLSDVDLKPYTDTAYHNEELKSLTRYRFDAEVGDFSRFDSPDKLLAYAGMSPSTYQSGQLKNCYPHMEKRGSRYLRYALYNAAKYVCHWAPAFAAYLAKKRAEGKYYNVALSHAAKKLVRLIFALEKSRQPYCPAL